MTRTIKLGMVGGGSESSIGPTHRRAAALAGRYDLVAGVFSRDSSKSRSRALELGIAPDRVYLDFDDMAERESERADGIEAVSIVTPNDTHAAASLAFLEHGIHVLCDKPMATSVAEATAILRAQERTGLLFSLTHNYAAYPMTREARERVASGELGAIRLVQVEYVSGGRSRLVEAEGDSQTSWRMDPAMAGPSAVLADLGTHAHHLVRYVTGLDVEAVSAELDTFVPGRLSHDNAHVSLRLTKGAKGFLWASYIAAGHRNGLRLRVIGEQGSLEWVQENPEILHLRPLDGPEQVLRRGEPWLGPAAQRASHVKAGQPEGFLEAFANLYTDVAEAIDARVEGREPDPLATTVATGRDGVLGMRFIEAAIESYDRGGAWADATLSFEEASS